MPEIRFTKVRLPHGWLGNMSPHPVSWQGKDFRTAEALFQAMRFADEAVVEEIRAQKSPMAAKMAAKRHAASMIVDPRGARDLENMRLVIRAKIDQNPGLREALLGTGDATIIEDCTKRRGSESSAFWGAALVDGEWVGQNALGRLWMELREEIRATR